MMGRGHHAATKLVLTVSGGLEELAAEQIRTLLLQRCSSNNCDPSVLRFELGWQHRGQSGSQLGLTLEILPGDERGEESAVNDDEPSLMATTILDLLKELDFVEYVFVLLDSLKLDNADAIDHNEEGSDKSISVHRLLQRVESAASTIEFAFEKIDFCQKICDGIFACQSSRDTEDTTTPIGNHCCSSVGLESLPGLLLPALEIDATISPDRIFDSPPTTSKCHTKNVADINTIYTKDVVAQAVIQRILEFFGNNDESTSLWIDAGSGNGALLRHLPVQTSVGIDTNPVLTSSSLHRVLRKDFLKVSKPWLAQQELLPTEQATTIRVVSNPPFAVSSRGDYMPIVRFINHSLDELGAETVAVICPTKFANTRIWKALDMTTSAHLLGRFGLPQNSFVNPVSRASVHIHSCCLIFGNQKREQGRNPDTISEKSGTYLFSKRDRGAFPCLSTASLTSAIASGLSTSLELATERSAKYVLKGQLANDASSLDLWWHANPQRPCSLVNSTSMRVPNHSLGWISLSCKPPVALAMSTKALQNLQQQQQQWDPPVAKHTTIDANVVSNGVNSGCLAINLLSGEGTIELESNRVDGLAHACFWIGGDKTFERVRKTAQNLCSLRGNSQHRRHLVDMVVWDAERLPLRKGIADVVLADLPFQGSTKRAHREPVLGHPAMATSSSLDYSRLFAHACRVLRPRGRAVLLSPDVNALKHAFGRHHNWSPHPCNSNSINLGGLSGKLNVMERREACTKDVSMWVSLSLSENDWSSWILSLANEAYNAAAIDAKSRMQEPLVTCVRLHSTFYHEKKQSLSHCYRMVFHDELKNVQAKQLEQHIRQKIEENIREGMILR